MIPFLQTKRQGHTDVEKTLGLNLWRHKRITFKGRGYLPEPSNMAEFGSLTTCSLGFITATGGLFCLAAAKILHVVVVNINIEKVEIFIKFQKGRMLGVLCFPNEPVI